MELESLQPLGGGETATIRFSHSLQPGRHVASASVMDAKAEIDVDTRTAEIALEVLGHDVIEDGLTHLLVKAVNSGDLPAESIVLSALWESRSENADAPSVGGNERAAVIDRLEPGEDAEIAVPLRVSSGSYHVELVGRTTTIEATPDDNLVHATVDVEYVQLAATVEAVRTVGYATTGEGLVEVDLRVLNEGVATGSGLDVGLRCVADAVVECSESVASDPIQAGEAVEFTFALTVPQGTTPALAYAGALDDGFRWGENNVAEFKIEVPELAATVLALEVESSSRDEYWSDGTANVDVAFSLRDQGYAPLEGEQPVTFSCSDGESVLEDCGGETTVSLGDGFGPVVTDAFALRMPMGASLLQVEYGDGETGAFELSVPERIVGVERDVWECFSDRPGREADREGCGGWFAKTIEKWDHTKPVRVWASGDDDYIAVLGESLEELSPLLNLEFQRVETEGEADLKAYVGVTVEEARAVNFYCEHSLGCARSWDEPTNVTSGAIIGVWEYNNSHLEDIGLLDDRIRRTIVHELLHALVPIVHRRDALSILNVTGSVRMLEMNPMDEALIRLHSNPLIEPGMAMTDVEDLIVFRDELLDPPPPAEEASAIDFVRKAFVAFHEADSVGFRIRGSWVGCGHEFDSSDLKFASFGSGSVDIVRFKDRGVNAFIIRDIAGDRPIEYWRTVDGSWQKVLSGDIFDNTGWRSGFSNPFTMFSSVLLLADPNDIRVSEPEPGLLRLDVYLEKSLVNVPWSDSEVLSANLTIDAETHEIRSYFMSWQFELRRENACSRYSSKATEGEYGIDIEIPPAILRASQILRSLDLPYE